MTQRWNSLLLDPHCFPVFNETLVCATRGLMYVSYVVCKVICAHNHLSASLSPTSVFPKKPAKSCKATGIRCFLSVRGPTFLSHLQHRSLSLSVTCLSSSQPKFSSAASPLRCEKGFTAGTSLFGENRHVAAPEANSFTAIR